MKLKTIHEAKTSSWGPDTVIPIKVETTVSELADIVSHVTDVSEELVLRMFQEAPITLDLMVKMVTEFHETLYINDEMDAGGVGLGDMLNKEDGKVFHEILYKYEDMM